MIDDDYSSENKNAKSKTIDELKAFEINKGEADRSLREKLEKFSENLSAEEQSLLSELLDAVGPTSEKDGLTYAKSDRLMSVYLKPMQVHTGTEVSVFLKPMQVHSGSEVSVFLKPMQIHNGPDVSVFLKPMQTPPSEEVFLKPMQSLPPSRDTIVTSRKTSDEVSGIPSADPGSETATDE